MTKVNPGNVPKNVIEELRRVITGCDCDDCYSVVIAAFLNAWPGMWTEDESGQRRTIIILPMPKEAGDE